MPTHTPGSSGSPTSQDFKEKASDTVEAMAHKAADAARDVSDQAVKVARRAADQAGDAADSIKGAVDKSLKDQPMASLAVVAALGFVLGALWKS